MPKFIWPCLILVAAWIIFFFVRRMTKDSPLLVKLAVRVIIVLVNFVVVVLVAYLIMKEQFPGLEFSDMLSVLDPAFWGELSE